ncbi:MAG: hypothetical protein ONA90_02780 [candidate division KSB1 bacterium]|nr:hypothetical protein [candidate division KSB1 bacterium]
MAYYLVHAQPKPECLQELGSALAQNAFVHLRPFGKALTFSLRNARQQADGMAVWEEEDYCTPPLAEERAAVLDKYFDDIRVQAVSRGEGWKRIQKLAPLFPELVNQAVQ